MRVTKAIIVAMLVVLCSSMLLAQTVTGTLSGRVVDPTGAVIANASVSARNMETGLVREAKTNAEGYYAFNLVPIGRYEVTASFQGFKTVKKTGVEVTLNVNTNSEFNLTPATSAETIMVTGELPLIETASGEVKGSIDAKLIQDRPIAGRNFLSLVNTFAGYQSNPAGSTDNKTLSTGSSVSFNGTGSRGATFQIDGVNNDDSSENQNRQGVNLSTIREVQVLNNNFSAEFGRGYGAVVLVQTKQGTNKIHGDAFWFHNNSATSTRTYYLPTTYKFPASRKHDFGGTVGGPVVKDKLFFFGSFEGIRQGGSSTWRRDIMLPSDKVIIDDPTNPVPMTAADKAWIQSVFDRYPNVTPNDPTNGPRSYITGVKAHYPSEDYSGRMDWNINSRNTLTGRYQYSTNHNWSDEVIKGENTDSMYTQHNLGLTFTHIYSNSQTGEFRVGAGRRETTVGLIAGNDTPVLRFTNGGAQKTSGSTILGNAGAYPIERFQTDWQFVYNHYWQISPKVTFKFGTDIRPGQLNDLASANTRGTRYVTDNNVACPNTKYPNPPADCYHDSYWYFQRGMWGTSGSYSRSYGASELANNLREYNFFFQSDLRLAPTFTLNLGVRNEFVPATTERNNKVDYGYGDSNNFAPRIGFAWSPSVSNGFLSKLTGGPGKFSIRGGFAIAAGRLFQSYFSQDGASIRFSPPNGLTPSFDVKVDANKHFADPTNGYVFTPGPAQNRVAITVVDPNLSLPYSEQWNLTLSRELPSQMGLSVAYLGNRGIGLPYFNSENRALFPFIAPSADKFYANDPMRVWAGISFDHVCAAGEATPQAPVAGQTSQCINAANPYTNARRPDTRYAGITRIRNGSWSYYNSLQVTLNKRPTHGLAFQASYTFSKSIDTGSEATYTGLDANFPLTNDARSMRGLSMFDTPHRLAVTYSYELPFFKNERVAFLENHGASDVFSAIIGKMIGGWQISGTTTAVSGAPFTVVSGIDLNADGIGGDRPNILDTSYLGKSITDGHWLPGSTSTTYSQLSMPVSIFQNVYNPGVNNLGNLGRNTFRADGGVNFDTALTKNFRIAEGQKLMFRWEVYNMMNNVRFSVPGRTVSSPSSFMKISSQANGSRSMQFALRYIF